MIKKIISFIVIILIFAGAYYFFSKKGGGLANINLNNLEELKNKSPELASYIDKVIKAEEDAKKDPQKIENYATLGLAWKSLAEWSNKSGLKNYKDYYKKSLETYQKAIELTGRHNTLYITNAGKMAEYLEDYKLAEDYYKEAITISPGDVTYYVLLAELYEYRMNKTKEEIVAVYDDGAKVAIDRNFLEKRKESYLKRVNSN